MDLVDEILDCDSENVEILFLAKCKKTTAVFKTIIDIMSQIVQPLDFCESKSVKQICFQLSDKGVDIYPDVQKNVSTFAVLEKKLFEEYSFQDSSDLCIGVSMDALKSYFKTVKKNDELRILIMKTEFESFPNNIYFGLNRSKLFSVKFNIIQNICLESYQNYSFLLNLPTSTFVNLYKEIGGVKKNVVVSIKNKNIILSCNMIDIATKWIVFPLGEDVEAPTKDEIVIKSDNLKIASKISLLNDIVDLLMNSRGDLLLKIRIKTSSDLESGCVFISICNNCETCK